MLESFYPNYIPSYISFQVYGVTNLYMFPFVYLFLLLQDIGIYLYFMAFDDETHLFNTLCVF